MLTVYSQALFNVMLREFGVKGVKVQEVVSLDEEMMAFLEYEILVPFDSPPVMIRWLTKTCTANPSTA